METQLQTHALQVSGSCGPGAQLSLVSKHITGMYRILQISVRFPAGCLRLVRVYLMLCQDPSALTTALPPGTSLLSMLSPNDFLVGDDVTLPLDINLPVMVKGTWLKAHVVNADAFPHTISVLWSLKEIMEP